MQRSIDPHTRSARDIADELAVELGKSAAERDAAGGTPKRERDLLRASGLLSLVIPKELGGWGASWLDTYDVVRRIARVDGSLGHVFGFQHLLLATLQLFGSEAQWRPWFEATAREQLFWGNALNPLDRRTLVRWSETQAGRGRIDGDKSFCSGALDSDMLIVSAIDPATDKLLVAALPTSRSGIALRHDWDNMGQRQTDSGSARFEAVALARSEVLATPGPLSTPFAALRPCIAQLSLSNVYLGIAYGALDAARVYTSEQSRPWIASGVEHPSDDPFVLRHYGELWVELEAARLLTDEAARALDRAYARGPELTAEERAQAAVAIAVAKAKTTRVSLETTSRVFEVMGARATTARARVDRFWRNVRTHTLHDPVDYKLRDIGAYVLAGRAPTPSFYS
jgi:alkylation response protein AidB-like acyl-CoA dehydrogenase